MDYFKLATGIAREAFGQKAYPVICSWCGRAIEGRLSTVEHSHGMCDPCAWMLQRQAELAAADRNVTDPEQS